MPALAQNFLIDLVLILVPVAYILFAEKKTIKPETFGLGKLDARTELRGTATLFFSLIFISFVTSITLSLLGFTNYAPTRDVLVGIFSQGPAVVFYFFVVRIFAEEIFFRAFLVPRIGVVASSVAFAIAHIGYGSVEQLIGPFVLGLLLSQSYKDSNSLARNFVAHILYNAFAIAALAAFGSIG